MYMENKKNVEKIIEKLKGKVNPTDEQLDKIKKIADQYSDKSEEEVMVEIIKLNKNFSESMGKEEYEKKLKKIEQIRPLLNKEQKEKLDKVLNMLK